MTQRQMLGADPKPEKIFDGRDQNRNGFEYDEGVAIALVEPGHCLRRHRGHVCNDQDGQKAIHNAHTAAGSRTALEEQIEALFSGRFSFTLLVGQYFDPPLSRTKF